MGFNPCKVNLTYDFKTAAKGMTTSLYMLI